MYYLVSLINDRASDINIAFFLLSSYFLSLYCCLKFSCVCMFTVDVVEINFIIIIIRFVLLTIQYKSGEGEGSRSTRDVI